MIDQIVKDNWEIKSAKSGITYKVTKVDDSWACTCKDYEIRIKRNPKHLCKHIIRIKHYVVHN